jgi:hypothetical protein
MVRTKASEPYFPLLGEPLALDFLNTELWREGSTVDLIGDPHGGSSGWVTSNGGSSRSWAAR